MRKLLLTTAAFLLGLSACTSITDGIAKRLPGKAKTDQQQSMERIAGARPDYAVSSAHPLSTEAGLEMLAQGGSAVDAAIAVQAVLSLVEPQSSGLGGGAFMIFHDPATGITTSYDGREKAPASATPDMFQKADGSRMGFYQAVTGGRSVGVPGAVSMLTMVHEKYGKLDLATVLAPALRHAEDGFAVTPRLNKLATAATRLKSDEAATAYFFDAEGNAHPVGHILKNPDYAQTLHALIDQGPSTFYTGDVADKIIAAVNERAGPGTMTKADFAAYAPTEREVVCGTYRVKKICSMGPPSSGGVTLIEILQILANTSFDQLDAKSPEALHLMMEASRLAYADRNVYLADPSGMAVGNYSAADIVKGLINPDFATERSQFIETDKAMSSVAAGDPTKYVVGKGAMVMPGKDASPEPESTSHFSIIDNDGKVISMTTTVESLFGSRIMAGGMILNNQLTDFSFLPVVDGKPVANAPAPGKRPRSSMTPVIIFNEDGSVYAAFGSPGGPAIIGYVAKTLIALIDWDMSLQQAIDLPNIVVPRGDVLVETGFAASDIAALQALGHRAKEYQLTSGVYGFVLREDGIEGGADKRKEGTFGVGVVDAAR